MITSLISMLSHILLIHTLPSPSTTFSSSGPLQLNFYIIYFLYIAYYCGTHPSVSPCCVSAYNPSILPTYLWCTFWFHFDPIFFISYFISRLVLCQNFPFSRRLIFYTIFYSPDIFVPQLYSLLVFSYRPNSTNLLQVIQFTSFQPVNFL